MAVITVVEKVCQSIEKGANSNDFLILCTGNVMDTVSGASAGLNFWASVTGAMTANQIEVSVRDAAVAAAQQAGFTGAVAANTLMNNIRKG
jgi:hypothetical protein